MTFEKQNLGYRELHTLATFAARIAETGISGDVADTFYYDFCNDCGVCETENGNIITSDEF